MHDLPAFLLVSALAITTPGPDTALTIRNTLLGGRHAGMATAVGVISGQLAWALATSVGVVALLSASRPAFTALRLCGAAYLVFLGVQSLRAARRPDATAELHVRVSTGLPARAAWRQGVLSNLGNPKMAVFFTSLLPQFAGGRQFAGLFGLGLLFAAMTLAWLCAYAAVIAKAAHIVNRGRIRRTLEAVTGTVLIALGLRVATERAPS